MRYVFLLFYLLIAINIFGQNTSRAEKYFARALSYKANKNHTKAYSNIQRAIAENTSYSEAYGIMGQWYGDSKNFISAAQTFALAAQNCKDGYKKFALLAAQNYLLAHKSDSANYWLQNSKASIDEQKILKSQISLVSKLSIVKDTNQVRKLNTRINTKYPEFFPSLSADGQKLNFTRRINGVNEDFFYALPDTCGGWLTARNMGYPPNTASQESAFTISADDHYLFFMRSDNRSENGWGRGGCDLYLSYRKAVDSPWSVPESFGATINTPAFEGMPSLSPDITDLYFASNRPGGYGGLDIWVSHFSFGLWQLPVNLGPNINTAGDETAPFISSDNTTFYFASDGHLGLGGSDLFVSKKVRDTIWEKAENLAAPINSSADDHSIFICPNGKDVFFASDRGNTNGNLDIYETTLPERFAPTGTAFALCYVYDSLSQAPALLGSISLYDSLGNELSQYHSNKGDGSILISLPIGKTFYFTVRGFNYTPFEASINFPEACPKWCVLNFPLLPKNYVRPSHDTALLTVSFAKNETELTKTQLDEIAASLGIWKEKEDITIYINSYTDNTGTPLINIEKSTQRANKIAEEVLKMGFGSDIVVPTGFGDINELVPNDSPENQYINRRAEIVLRWLE